ncbi:MAG: tail-specific protease [Cytophagales bacterium]|nr:tail-specific protease [Cytophagales bacterium]
MKKLRLFLIALVLSTGTFAQNKVDSLVTLEPKQEHPRETILISQFLSGYHYNKTTFSDSLSSVVFDNLFGDLDPNRAYFLKKDVEKFESYRYELDQDIPNGDLEFGYVVFRAYREKGLERIQYVYELLENEFDFGKEEYFEFDRDKAPWPKNVKEQNEIWRKIIKNQALTYKLAGREWEDIAKSLKNRYQRVERALYQYNSEDVFQLYMRGFTSAYDPHTSYFSPQAAEDFEIDMSLSLEGIGARLSQQLDYTEVTDIVPGGPAFKGNELKAEDKIIGVAQGDEGKFDDVIGWRLSDVVQKIRGPKGTVVRLQILKASEGQSALPDTIRIVRDKIKLEEQEAKAEMIPITENGKAFNLGVISIPSFYKDFDALRAGERDVKSTTDDVKRLITELKEQGMDGLMIDLRYNGGGYLDEAILLSSLFLPKGPIVQVRDMRNQVERHDDSDKGKIFYDGPLTVLMNRYSASASEIFSGAIQDYKRGVVVGENSHGKGTVQNLVDLGPEMKRQINRMVSIYRNSGNIKAESEMKKLQTYMSESKVDIGMLKMTMAKFYRVTGNSTQRVGIAPDVHFPSAFDPAEVGESSRSNALPWDEIQRADFDPTNDVTPELIDLLNALYRDHLNSDPSLIKLVKEIERQKELRNQVSVSLNIEERKQLEGKSDDLTTEISIGDLTTEEHAERLLEDPYLKEGLRLLVEMARKKIG